MSNTRLKKPIKLRSRTKSRVSSVTKKTVVKTMTFRYNIEKSTAKREIQDFINKHPGALTSDVIEKLRIEPPLAVDIIRELKNEGLVVGHPVG